MSAMVLPSELTKPERDTVDRVVEIVAPTTASEATRASYWDRATGQSATPPTAAESADA